MNAKQLAEYAEEIFTKRLSMMLLWQEQAENFFPERADFTYQRQPGLDFAAWLMTSYPILCRRELSDQFSSMLRPTQKEWAHVVPVDLRLEDGESKRWLQMASSTMRRAMYDPKSKFTIATKAGDQDFATFGQTALSVRLNYNLDTLLYRCHHLRDVAWMDDDEGDLCFVARRWKPSARTLQRLFKDKIPASVQELLRQGRPFEQVDCMHIVVKAELYDDKPAAGCDWWVLTLDVQHDFSILEAVPSWYCEYVIPRWSRPNETQYAYSPATICALPDARLIQAMTYTILEASEKVTNPPWAVVQDAVRSDAAMYAGGLVWVDRDYDERTGEAIRQMDIDARGIPIGIENMKDARQLIAQAFYLNKLTLPQRGPEMTAYEVGQRIQEYIRGALPLFEPMEMEYNGGICKPTFDILRRFGAFGSINDMPRKLRDAPMQFRFESPLHDAIEEQKGHKFLEMDQLITAAIALDKRASAVADVPKALREALGGIQTPAAWVYTEQESAKILQKMDEAAIAQQQLEQAGQAAGAVAQLASAARDGAAAGPRAAAPVTP